MVKDKINQLDRRLSRDSVVEKVSHWATRDEVKYQDHFSEGGQRCA